MSLLHNTIEELYAWRKFLHLREIILSRVMGKLHRGIHIFAQVFSLKGLLK